YEMPRTYRSMIKQYTNMAKQEKWGNVDGSIWPISLPNLLKFLTVKSKKVAPHTLYSYLAALAFQHRVTHHFGWDKAVKRHPAVPALLCVEPTNDETCPMQALLQYLLVRRKLSYGKDSQILFCYENGSPVTREQFMNSIHMCLPGTNIDARSFRSGGATFWTLKGMPEIMIQREGRWSSAAFQRYIRYTVPVRRALRVRANQI